MTVTVDRGAADVIKAVGEGKTKSAGLASVCLSVCVSVRPCVFAYLGNVLTLISLSTHAVCLGMMMMMMMCAYHVARLLSYPSCVIQRNTPLRHWRWSRRSQQRASLRHHSAIFGSYTSSSPRSFSLKESECESARPRLHYRLLTLCPGAY